MKKAFSLLLAMLMVVSAFAFSALSVAAAENIIYIKDNGTGDGSSAEKPLGSYADAVEKAATMTGDVTIQVVDEITIPLFLEPEHPNKITLTGGKITLLSVGTTWWALGGDMVIKDVKFELCSNVLMRTNMHNLTFDDGVVIDNAEGTYAFNIRVISLDTQGFDAVNHEFVGNPVITLKSGTFADVCAYNNGSVSPYLNGKFTVNLMGTATVNNIVVCRNSWENAMDAEFNLLGGRILRFTANCDRSIATMDGKGFMPGVKGTLTYNIGKDFKIADSFNADNTTTFYGISGASVVCDAEKYIDKAEFVLNIDESVYEEFNQLNDTKVQFDSFDKVTKVSGSPAATEAPTTTVAPTTTAAPITTAAPATTAAGEVTPATGDASRVLVIAAAAVLCTAAVVVIKKREN